MIPDRDIWLTILFLGVGTYAIRLSFIGLVGQRDLPEWALRHLRYVPVAVMPGLVAPLVVWPGATGGEIDPDLGWDEANTGSCIQPALGRSAVERP